MGTIPDGLDDHEGYAERHRSDAPVTGTSTDPTAAIDAYVAACGCGWRGGAHASTEGGYEAAVGEWERIHARPLLAHTVPIELRHMISDVTNAMRQLIEDRPVAGLEALRTLAAWADGVVAKQQTIERLARQGRRPTPSGPAAGRHL